MKNIIITGASGGIGSVVAKRFLGHGWHTHLLLRSFDKPEVQDLMKNPNVSAYKSDPENEDATLTTIQSLKNDFIIPDFVFHCAGTFLWDDGFPGKEDLPSSEIEEFLWKANIKTKESLEKAIKSVYSEELSLIEQAFVGSHASNFSPDGPERTGKFKEEFYVNNMLTVKKMAEELISSKMFKNIFLFEPGLINTEMAQKAFIEERIGFKIDWSKVPTPQQYAESIFPEDFFKARQ